VCIYIYIYGCFLKWWYPQNTPKWSFLVGKPMVVGYHHFRKPPYTSPIDAMGMIQIATCRQGMLLCYLSPKASGERQTKLSMELWRNWFDSANGWPLNLWGDGWCVFVKLFGDCIFYIFLFFTFWGLHIFVFYLLGITYCSFKLWGITYFLLGEMIFFHLYFMILWLCSDINCW